MTDRPPADDASSGSRFVITLMTLSLPMPVKLHASLKFPGLAVFRSRSVEDGRERFRLHLGYFGSVADARAVLTELRPHYPRAFVAPVPGAAGSLDDTLNTAFTFVRSAVATLVPAPEPAPTAAPAPPLTETPAPTLTPDQVASALAPQRYAVQLDWSLRPINPNAVPRLAIFRAYRLYAVSVQRQGSAEHGLRLGFFKELDAARQVADYVRHGYPSASVVPVSYREYERASALTRPEPAPATATGYAVVEERGPPPAEPRPAPVTAPSAVASARPRTREEMLSLLGAHDLEVAHEREPRAVLTAEERELLTRRPRRALRSW
jgi:hypothetical protein